MKVERTDSELILRLPLDIGTYNLDKISRYLKYSESVGLSNVNEDEINSIADESKKRWWSENKHKYIK
jgi:hypothetical protein